MPPTKDQTDIGVDNPGVDASDGALYEEMGELKQNKDMARQEFAKDADINHMLSKFGITPERGAPTFGEWDDSIDLQQALTSVAEAKAAFKDLPDELKKKFNNIEELLTAYNRGDLIIKDGEAPIPAKTETELLRDRVDELMERINNTGAATTPNS